MNNMRPARIVSIAIFTLMIMSVFTFVDSVYAEEEPALVNVISDFTINMRSATDFSVNVEMNVIWAISFGQQYTESEIQSLLTSSNIDDIEALAVIKNNVHNSLSNQMIEIFGDGNIHALNSKPTIESSLFIENFDVNLSSEFFGMSEPVNIYEFVNGVLDMGANVTYTFDLIADAGWNNTYKFVLLDKMVIKHANTTYVDELVEATWTVLNRAGTSLGKTAELTINYKNPTTPASQTEDIFLGFELDCTSEKPTILNINLDGLLVNIGDYNVTPDFISNFDNVPSDGLRLYMENELITLDDIKLNTFDPLKEKIIQTLKTPAFNHTLDLTFEWDNFSTFNHKDHYDIENMDSNPPIRGILTNTDIALKINDITSQALFGLVNAGAVANISENNINFGDRIKTIGNSYNISIIMPEEVVINDEKPYTWNDTKTFTGDIFSKNPPTYTEEEIHTVVEVNVKTTDLNLLSFFTGNTQLTFGLTLSEECNYNVTNIPDEFSIPDKISLEYLNADALRVCFEEKIFSDEETDLFLTSEKEDFEKRAAKIIDGVEINGNINRDIFEKSLQWDGDISKMGKETPVKTASYAHTTHPVSFALSIAPPSVKIPTQTYNFTAIDGQTVTYKIVFPNGVNIGVSDALGKAEVKEMPDGRKYFELTIGPEDTESFVEVKCDISPSALFLIGVFIPCIVSFFITLILIIIVLMLRKKRKGRVKAPREPVAYDDPIEEEAAGFEEEEYYVPPPPGSK